MSSYKRIHRETFEIEATIAEADERRRNPHTPLDEVRRSWLLRPTVRELQRRINLGCIVMTRNVFMWTLALSVVAAVVLVGLTTNIARTVPRHHHQLLSPDNYTVALSKALKFFHAQQSGKLPKSNNISWRGDSCLKDGYNALPSINDLVGGYFDGGDSIKFHFPQAFSMTTLSWSVIEYASKYEAAGELNHVKQIIKWGTDYLLKCFDSTADTIDRIAAQVGTGGNNTIPNDHFCWMRPEDIDYIRHVAVCSKCSDLAAEMAAALASASIVFKEDVEYSEKLVHGALVLFDFSKSWPGKYSTLGSDAELFYNSTSYWDEYIWGAAWLYYATGDSSYLSLATDSKLAKRAGVFLRGPDYGVFSWDNKLVGAQLLLTRLRLLMDPGYPYDELLITFHEKISSVMCSYLPFFKSFNRTEGGLIELNHGSPRPLQYVVNAAFIATLYTDYLAAANIPGWYCGPDFYKIDVLRNFSETQIQYILGKNPRNMSYLVGFGDHYPVHVHHRAASIPKNKIKYSCEQGTIWRDTPNPNPNIVVGAMVGGPDKHDGFHDVRSNYGSTEPTLAGNAGLVAALVSLSGDRSVGIDKKGIFSAIPPMFPDSPPPPTPWTP